MYSKFWEKVSTKDVFKSEGKIKTFLDKQKLREYISTRLALQEILKGVVQGKMRGP